MSNACVLFFQSLPLFWVRLYWKRFGIFTDQMAVASFPCENIKVSSLEIEFMINSKYKCIDHPVSMPQNINNQKWISLTDLQWITWIITCKTCSWLYFCNFTPRYFLDKKYLTDLILNLQLRPCFGCAKWMHLHYGEGYGFLFMRYIFLVFSCKVKEDKWWHCCFSIPAAQCMIGKPNLETPTGTTNPISPLI